MAITVEMNKDLRAQTGAGMMDCKKALTETQGDVKKAVEILRKKGLAGLAKRAGRSMKEGLVASVAGKEISLVEFNCETDFVARNPDVAAFVKTIATEMAEGKLQGNPAEDEGVKSRLQEIAMKIGENMAVRRGVSFPLSEKSVIGSYIHFDNKKGALVEMEYEGDMAAAKAEIEHLAHELALQAVAMNPKFLSPEEVPAEVIAKEKEIYQEKMRKDEEEQKAKMEAKGKTYRAKPADALEKMLTGKIHKYYSEVCLLEQATIDDPKISVKQSVEALSKKLGAKLTVKRFVSYQVGVE